MKPPPFDYVAVTTIAEALEALSSVEDARVLAGGQSLVPLLNLRLARPSLLVDCNGVEALAQVGAVDGVMRIGSMCRHRRLELDPDLVGTVPLLSQAASLVGHPQIRNRATLGGSLAHADPASELAAACLALGAGVNVRDSVSERVVALVDLFEGSFVTTLEPRDMIVSVDIPMLGPGWGFAFREYAPRHGDFALAGVAAAVERVDRKVGQVRLAGCGTGSTVADFSSAADGILGESLTDSGLRAMANEVGDLVAATDDVHASAVYRRELAEILAVEAIRGAWANSEVAA
jgi:carbon-monoxide dehydrogenase medium subunit